MSTFPLFKVEDDNIEAALQQVLNRYKKTGIGVWVEQEMSANKHNITTGEFEETPEKLDRLHSKAFSLPIDVLTNPELADDFTTFQNKLHTAILKKDKINIADARKSFENLKEKYGNSWLQNILEKENFPILALYEAMIKKLELSSSNEVQKFIESYINESTTTTQESIDILISYVLKGQLRGSDTIPVFKRLLTLKSINLTPILEALCTRISPRSDSYKEAMEIIKELADTKMNDSNKIQVYNILFEKLSWLPTKMQKNIVKFIFNQKNPLAFMPHDISGYSRFIFFSEKKNRPHSPQLRNNK